MTSMGVDSAWSDPLPRTLLARLAWPRGLRSAAAALGSAAEPTDRLQRRIGIQPMPSSGLTETGPALPVRVGCSAHAFALARPSASYAVRR